MRYHDFWPSDLDLVGWPTLKKKIVQGYDFWIRGVTYCCYLQTVAAGELCNVFSDNSGLNSSSSNEILLRCHYFYIFKVYLALSQIFFLNLVMFFPYIYMQT